MNRKRIYRLVLITSVIFVLGCTLLGVMRCFKIHIPCAMETLTGLRCPACGATRASMQLLTLDFKGAFFYNPMIFFIWLYIIKLYTEISIGYLKYGGIIKKRLDWFDISGLAIIMLWGIVRNLIGA